MTFVIVMGFHQIIVVYKERTFLVITRDTINSKFERSLKKERACEEVS